MLTMIDGGIIVTYLGLLWGVGLWISFRHRKQDSDFMLNRHYSWFNIGSSIFATNIGPSFLLGAASAAYAAGMATANFEWLAWIFLLLLGTVCAPYYIRMRITTMPEFIRRRFGSQAADFLSFYGLFTVVIMWIGGDLFVGGKLLNQILGYPEWACMIALALVFMTFTAAGGFSAVMVTDTAQAVLMIGSMLVLNVIAFTHVGSLHNLVDKVPGEFWQLFRPADDTKYPWIAIVLGYPVIGFWFWCTDQTIVQRMLGARDLKQAQLGTIYTGFLKILPPFLFMMPGIFCLVLQPGLENSDKAFLTMLKSYMPIGMMGLMIAVLFAASVAGVAGGLNAFSTIFTMDIYKRKLRPDSTDHHLKRVSQVSIVCVTIAAIGAALMMQGSKKNIFDTLQGIICYFAPPMASIFLMSLIWKRVTTTAVKTTLYLGTSVCLTVGVLSLRNILPASPWTHFMMLTFLLFLFCLALLVVVSLLTQHSECEESLVVAKTGAVADAAGHGAGKLGAVLWVVLAVVMIGLYSGFQRMSVVRQRAEIYLSPTGDDLGNGSGRKPFKTLERARARVREMKAAGSLPDGGVKIWMHGGIYQSDKPLVLGSEDSGEAGKPILWLAFPGEKPVVSGGVSVKNWVPDVNGRFKATVNIDNFRQLWVNGQRAKRARGAVPAGLKSWGKHEAKAKTQENPPGLTGIPGCLAGTLEAIAPAGYTAPDAKLADWRNPGDMEFGFYSSWTHSTSKIEKIIRNEGGVIIEMSQPGFFLNCRKGGSRAGYPAYMENALELLDEPGEWYFDRPAHTLYYLPRPGEDMAKTVVIAPKLEKLLEVKGSLDQPVHDVQFKGLTFSHATWLEPSTAFGHPDGQANLTQPVDNSFFRPEHERGWVPVNGEHVKSPANVVVDAGHRIRFDDCTFTALGGAGLDLQNGAQDNIISGCRFYDISSSGVQIGDVTREDHHPTDPRRIVKGNQVLNSVFTRIGAEYTDAIGIFYGYTEGTVIAHNEVFGVPYTGVSGGWGWGMPDAGGGNYACPIIFKTPTTCKNNRIEFNHIHDVMKVRHDGGGIYTLSRQPGTIIRGNHIYDSHAPFGGIYLDEGSAGIEVTGNVIYRAHTPVFYHTCGRDKENKTHDNFTAPPASEGAMKIANSAGLEPLYQKLLDGLVEPKTNEGGR